VRKPAEATSVWEKSLKPLESKSLGVTTPAATGGKGFEACKHPQSSNAWIGTNLVPNSLLWFPKAS